MEKYNVMNMSQEAWDILSSGRRYSAYELASTDIVFAWEVFHKDLSLEEEYLMDYLRIPSKEVVFNEDKYWDKMCPEYYDHTWKEHHTSYIEDVQADKHRLESMDWHHIEEEPIPDWEIAVNNINRLLKI